MSTIPKTAEPALAAELMPHLSRSFKRLRRAYQEWRKRQRLRAFLHGLPDRILSDIGITRGEIEWLASHGLTPTRADADEVAADQRRPCPRD